ncbi:hypothetical protein JB92DRAFT_2706540, partial [Gautieria morchelliformis]
PPSLTPSLLNVSPDRRAGKCFQIASFVMMVYDHRVQLVWKPSYSGATLLFAINRYATPLQFLVITVAFQSAAWSDNVGAPHSHSLLVSMPHRVSLPPGFVGCILTGSGRLFTPFWAMPLITDSVVFLLTILRTRLYANEKGRTSPLLQLFVRDGALYFLCIFSANLLNVVLFLVATEDLKAIGASFSQIITSVMISRLVLNLRILRADMHGNSAPSVRNQGRNRIDASGDTSQKKSFFDPIITTLTEESSSRHGVDHIDYSQSTNRGRLQDADIAPSLQDHQHHDSILLQVLNAGPGPGPVYTGSGDSRMPPIP